MRALTWQGRRSVSVETVPDPVIQQPNDAIIKVTSTAICGSDLHLYEVLGPFLAPRRRARPRDDGHRPGGRPGGGRPQGRRPGRRPVQHLVRPLLDVLARPVRAVRDDAEREDRQGCLAVRLHRAVRLGARRSGRVPPGAARRSSGRSRCPRGSPTSATSTCPTSCRPPGRRSSSPTCPRAAPSRCSGSDRSAS